MHFRAATYHLAIGLVDDVEFIFCLRHTVEGTHCHQGGNLAVFGTTRCRSEDRSDGPTIFMCLFTDKTNRTPRKKVEGPV